MLGQAHAPRRRLLGIAAVASVVLTVPAIGGADPSQTAQSLRQENANLEARSRTAVLSLYSLDSRLASARARLASLQAERARLRRERASLATQLHVARAGVAISQRRLESRLRLLYEQGDVSTIEVVLGSKNLDDAIAGIESLGRVASLDESVLAELERARRTLGGATRSLQTRAAALEAATREAAATASSLEATRAERQRYIVQLADRRRLNTTQIARIEEQAQAARARAEELASAAPVPDPEADAPAPAAAVGGGATITVTATGYALTGTTATGIPVGWGVAAVDPSVIPLGTHMTIPGYGDAVAADTGGAVVGSTIDLWFPSPGQAQAWGRRTVTISLR